MYNSNNNEAQLETNPFILHSGKETKDHVQISSTIESGVGTPENLCSNQTLTDNPSILHSSCESMVNDCYFDKLPELKNCPFSEFHHSGLPSEFLQYPLYYSSDKRCQHILDGIDDHSSGINMKIQFIISNLKGCMGMWPQIFLQKLNAIVVNADHGTVKAVLSKDDFAIMRELATQKNLIPALPTELKDQLMEQLQKDFSLAGQNLCRCRLDIQCNNSECETDEEHRKISSHTQNSITAVLMYILAKVNDHSNASNFYIETPFRLNADKFIRGSVVHLYVKLYETADKAKLSRSDFFLMETLSYLIVAFHSFPSKKNLFSSAIELMLDMGWLSAVVKVKDTLLTLVQREADIFQKGPGSQLTFVNQEIRLSFATLGISAVIKCLISLISSVEYQVLSRDEQKSLMSTMIAIQTYLEQSGYWNNDCENIYLHCRHLQCILERKLGYLMTDIKLDSDTDTANSSGLAHSLECLPEGDSSDSSHTSETKLHPSRKNPKSEYKTNDDWKIGVRSISQLRKSYENEIKLGNVNEQEQSWISRWMSRTTTCFVNCTAYCFNKRQ